MNARDFCFWCQGFFEMSPDGIALTPAQVRTLRNHLNLVFKHDIDPAIDGGDPVVAAALNAVHHPTLAVDPSIELPRC